LESTVSLTEIPTLLAERDRFNRGVKPDAWVVDASEML
jgi:hypothetical protein